MDAVKKLRITLAAMTVFLIVFLIISTGKGTKDDVDLRQVADLILQNISDADSMQEKGSMELKSLYGLSANDYEQAIIYVPVSNMDAAEMLLIKCSDESQTESVQSAMEQRIQDQTGIFESYGVEQMAIISKAVVDIKDEYCLYVVSRYSETAEDIFESEIRE
jgi:hypothetical protein